MEKKMKRVVLYIFSAALCSAGTINDVFNQAQGNCNYSQSAPYGNCDVIGTPSDYDIQQASVTVAANGFTTVTLYTDHAGVTTQNSRLALGGFTDAGVTLLPGDLFFYAPANSTDVNKFFDPSVLDFADPQANIEPYLTYAVPLVSHDGLTAGDLYQVTTTSNIETASQALGSPNAYYRANLPVLIGGGLAVAAGSGVNVANFGDGTLDAAYAITLSFTAPVASNFTSWANSGQIGILWSSTDCGNDFIQGDVNMGVPEPTSFALLLTGAALIAVSAFARHSTAKSRK
jgi:hypothetical protein